MRSFRVIAVRRWGLSRVLALVLACVASIAGPLTVAADALEAEPARSFDEGDGGGYEVPQEVAPQEGQGFDIGAQGWRVLDRINNERAARGLAALRLNEELSRAAAKHSQEMACQSLMTHTSIDGSNPMQRALAEGYRGRGVGEAVGMGFAEPEQVVAAWMASPEHRKLLLSERFREASIGFAESAGRSVYWTVDFGIPHD